MYIKEIVRDSLLYPLSNWKKFLILGILVFISNFDVVYTLKSTIHLSTIHIAGIRIIQFIVELLILGYMLKIMKSTLDDKLKLPRFASWYIMLTDGIKVSIISIFYLIPVILFIIAFLILFPSNMEIIIKSAESGTSIMQMLLFMVTNFNYDIYWTVIAIFYMIIVYPIIWVAATQMASNDNKIGAAFKFREILNKIAGIGWKNFIIWYIAIGIIYLIIDIIKILILTLLEYIFQYYPINYPGIKILLFIYFLCAVLITAFLIAYLARAVALIYISEGKHYLECENCGGRYELQPSESPEDFEECECGGELRYH
nr:DUF4013 domain-containing protein [uncultured Methanobacterium sp.]